MINWGYPGSSRNFALDPAASSFKDFITLYSELCSVSSANTGETVQHVEIINKSNTASCNKCADISAMVGTFPHNRSWRKIT